MPLDQSLIDAAMQQTLSRFPSGYAGAAAVRTETGQILTRVRFDPPISGPGLCHEAGAYCEPSRPFLILAPCGICQERLALWGPDVEVTVAVPGRPSAWHSKLLSELRPRYWRNAVKDASE